MLIKTKLVIAALFMLGLICQAVPQAAAQTSTSAPRFVVTVEGEGKPVLFLPGLTSSPRAFQFALEGQLDAEIHWVTLAGFAGVAPSEPTDDIIGATTAALITYIKAEDLHNLRLVGHSMGGVLSLLIAGELPDRVESVLIVDSVPFLSELFQPGITEDTARQQATRLAAQFNAMTQDQFLTAMRQGLPRQATGPDAQAFVFQDIEASDKATVAAATAHLMATDYGPALAAVQAPVTVLVPHNTFLGLSPDQVKARYETLYDGLATVMFKVINNSRHFIMLDQPTAFNAALKTFLEQD